MNAIKIHADLEAEKVVLSALVMKRLDFADIDGKVTTTDFHEAKHREIFIAIREMWSDGDPIDLSTVCKQRPDHALYIDEITANYITAVTNVDHYIDCLKEATKERELVRTAEYIQNQLINSNGRVDVSEIAADAIERLKDIDQGAGGVKLNPVKMVDIHPANPESLLFKNRLLARGQFMMLSAPSGAGKSVFLNQAAYCFAGGKTFFGMQPLKPLRVYVMQAEDDPEIDVYPMRAGIRHGLIRDNTCTESDIDEIENSDRLFMERYSPCTQSELVKHIRAVIDTYHPDVIALNPLFAYACCNIESSVEIQSFLRNTLQPLIDGCQVEKRPAVIIVHHPTRERSRPADLNISATEHLHNAHGSVELTNFHRVILSIAPVKSGDLLSRFFLLLAPKHGDRFKWVDDDGNPTDRILIAHSTPNDARDGLLYWRHPDQYEIDRLMQIQNDSKADYHQGKAKRKNDQAIKVVKAWAETITEPTALKTAQPRLANMLDAEGLPSGNDARNRWEVYALDQGLIKRDPTDRTLNVKAFYLPGTSKQ